MKMIGLSLGTKMGNNEVLVKEALMGAEELGVEVEFIRVLDYDIRACRGCIACAQSLFVGGDGKCVIKDDLHIIDEKILDCDGMIISAPVFVLGPHGLLKVMADRFGPSHDLAWRMEAKKIAAKQGKKGPDERSFKPKVAGFISVGGASTPHWLSLGLPLMNLITFSSHFAVADQMQVTSISKGSVLMNDDAIKRARKLGRNVAKFMGKPHEEVKWMGDEQGTCPVCHSNLLTITDKNPVECPICGISGTLKIVDGKIKVTFSKKEQARSRLTMAGKLEHWDELGQNFKFMAQQNPKELTKRKAKYIGYAETKTRSKKGGRTI